MYQVKPGEALIVAAMPNDDYQALPALGSGAIATMIRDPFEFWGRYIKGWTRPPTDAMSLGTIRHVMMLEGRAAFDRLYCVEPQREDYPDALDTADDMREAVWEIDPDAKIKAATKAKLRDLLESLSPGVEYWDEVRAKAIAGRETVSPQVMEEMQRARDVLEATGIASLFRDGWPEVSIFWERDGVQCKARLDWLRLLEGALTDVDLKTYSNPMGKASDQIAAHAVMYSRYGLQRQWYAQGLKAVRDALTVRVMPYAAPDAEPAPRAEVHAAQIAEAVATARRDHRGRFPRSLMLFQRTGPIPTPILREYLDVHEFLGPTRYARRDREDIAGALQMYRRYRDEWPEGAPWGRDFREGISVYDDTDFPPFYLSDSEGDE